MTRPIACLWAADRRRLLCLRSARYLVTNPDHRQQLRRLLPRPATTGQGRQEEGGPRPRPQHRQSPLTHRQVPLKISIAAARQNRNRQRNCAADAGNPRRERRTRTPVAAGGFSAADGGRDRGRDGAAGPWEQAGVLIVVGGGSKTSCHSTKCYTGGRRRWARYGQ